MVVKIFIDSYHPFGLALDSDALYWSDWGTKSVHKYNMTSSVTQVLIAGMGRPMELHIYSSMETLNGMYVWESKSLVVFHNHNFFRITEIVTK